MATPSKGSFELLYKMARSVERDQPEPSSSSNVSMLPCEDMLECDEVSSKSNGSNNLNFQKKESVPKMKKNKCSGVESSRDLPLKKDDQWNKEANARSSYSAMDTGRFLSDDHRNQTYDAWFDKCEEWEKKRLKWLCDIARMNGYDESSINRSTFLRKGPSNDSESRNGKCPDPQSVTLGTKDEIVSDETSQCFELENKSSVSQFSDVWDEWYRIERLHRHKSLYNDGLPNWYNNILAEEEKRYEQKLSLYSSLEEAKAEHERIQEQLCPEIYGGEEYKDSFYFTLTNEDMLVYQLTDHKFWLDGCRRYSAPKRANI